MNGRARKLSIQLRAGSDHTLVELRGVIDEDNQLAALPPRLDGRTVIVDLAGIDRINSCGVRDWVGWLETIERQGKRVIMARCSPAMVAQLNVVTNFSGAATVSSVLAPYYCEACDAAVDELLRVDALPRPAHPPAVACPGCGRDMVFDDFEDSYFTFLETPGPKLGAQTEKLLNSLFVADRPSVVPVASHDTPVAQVPDTPAPQPTPRMTRDASAPPLVGPQGQVAILARAPVIYALIGLALAVIATLLVLIVTLT